MEGEKGGCKRGAGVEFIEGLFSVACEQWNERRDCWYAARRPLPRHLFRRPAHWVSIPRLQLSKEEKEGEIIYDTGLYRRLRNFFLFFFLFFPSHPSFISYIASVCTLTLIFSFFFVALAQFLAMPGNVSISLGSPFIVGYELWDTLPHERNVFIMENFIWEIGHEWKIPTWMARF